ncbi:hypothetical protein PQ077_02165 [Litorivicinus sp.]|nr:hypothetical protein [Litorivicinus sp.]
MSEVTNPMKKESRTTYRTDLSTHKALDDASKQLNVPKSCLIDQFVKQGIQRLRNNPSGWIYP